ncbi:MAG TPA: class I SAM-dependent methyltransferase, partial [Lautropia sp.]|nr:class I SAM-dependent methyltransferase [Lautropia sp.]
MTDNVASSRAPTHGAGPHQPSRPPRLDRRLLDEASARYRQAGLFAYFFARGKLSGDPAFGSIVHQGWIRPASRVLDLGCGQGLLASLLLAADHGCRVRGIELLPAEVDRARKALGEAAEIVCGDIQEEDFGETDTAVILDVLHYIDYPAQDQVLRRLRAALPPGGLLLLRVGDADGGLRFRYSNLIDHLVFFFRGSRRGRLYCRGLAEWRAVLETLGFHVDVVPLSHGTLFANVLL